MQPDRIECKAAFEVDDAGLVTGKAWDFSSPDRVGDVITPEAFAKAVPPLPMLFAHDQSQVVGSWTGIHAGADGLTVSGKLLVNDVARAAEVRAMLQAKAVTGLSVGFMTKKSAPRRGGGRTITDLDLVEVSIVAVPAHPGARISTVKELPSMTDITTEPTEADVAAIVTKAVEPLTTSTTALAARLDKLEARASRPTGKADDEPSAERKAFATYLRLGSATPAEELKALNVSSDPQGGYLAPPELATEILRDLVEYSPIRAVASVRGTSAPSTIYPTRGDLTNARWVGENQTRTESEITFGQKELAVKELATYVDISNRLLADAPQAEVEVRSALSEDFGKKEATAFVWGNGALEPEGFMVNPDIAYTANGHATDLKADALITLLYALPATYRNAGAWAMNGTTLATIRRLKDGQNNYLWQPSYQAGQPETILGRPVIEMIDMPDVGADAFPIVYGDFQAYRILDREGMSILVDPYTRAVNGITRIHANRRVGGGVLQAARLRKLKMATS